MREVWVEEVMEAIHSTPTQAVIYFAGGASQVPAQFTSRETARNWLYWLIIALSSCPSQVLLFWVWDLLVLWLANFQSVGTTGFTCQREHRPTVGIYNYFIKGLRTREQEERVSSQILLEAIGNACKVPSTFVSELTESEVPDECEIKYREEEEQELEQLICGQICFKIYPFCSDKHASNAERKIILSGSFNPLHDGHLKLLEVATSMYGFGYPCFEIPAVNADKPPLTVAKIKDRIEQFQKVGKSMIIFNQPYFYKKAELFPGSSVVIGADTAPKYYENDYGKMLEILLGCKNTGCSFLVGGRNVEGVFKVLEDIDIPEELTDMFVSIPAAKFGMDISSTEIRKSQDIVTCIVRQHHRKHQSHSPSFRRDPAYRKVQNLKLSI